MGATLTIDRSNLGLADLVLGDDDSTGFTLASGFSMGVVAWRKATNEQANVPGRVMGDVTRDTMTAVGGVNCFGADPVELQDRIAEAIEALTQVQTSGFAPFDMTYRHIGATTTAVYQFTCLEPADVTPGNAPDGTLDDAQMASLIQVVGFAVVRRPKAVHGPI